MIEIHNLTKQFEDIRAVDEVSVTIREKTVFGLIGTNGAGKSTVLRMIAGVIKPDEGTVAVDNMPVYDNVEAKKRLFFIADEPYFFANANARAMEKYYSGIYEAFDREEFYRYLEKFNLDKNRKIGTFSKGMKKQLSVILGLSAGVDYIFCDETFDGLDPVMRHAVKSLFAADVADRGLTPIIASHNLRELEDICDHVGLLHRGGVLLEKDLDDMKLGAGKVQCVLPEGVEPSSLGLNIVIDEQRGQLHTLIARGTQEEIMTKVAAANPVFMEFLPLTLEEFFIMETEVAGYDLKKLFI